jgi:hypothetical protein
LGAFSIKDQNIYANKLEVIQKDGDKCECTWGYIISKNACKKMLSYFKYNSIRQAVDYSAYYKNNIEKLYYLNESIVMAPAFHYEDKVDSDIQNNMDFFKFDE